MAVGPADAAWIAADRRFPDEQLPDDRQLHRLTVVLSFGATTQANVVDLPPHGTSTTCRFAVTVGPGPDPVEARIIVGFRNRILQTAVLRGWVLPDPETAPAGSAIDLSVEAMPRPAMSELDERKPFGAALVVSDDAGGRTAVGLGSDRMSRFDLDEIAPAVEPLTLILSRIADDPDALGPALDSPGSVELLRDLAVQGVELYQHLGKQVVEELAGDDLDRLQVVSTNPRTFVPVEFVYDLPPPSPKAGLCPKWKTALRTGRCDHADLRLDAEGLAGLVCPLGFWCLRKVIERHVADRADLGPAGTFAVRSDPSAERSSLAPFAGGLFAASERVTKPLAGGVLRAMSTATGKHAEQVTTWSDWAAAVKARRPALLVLLSHTADDAAPVALEIGAEGERRAAAQITDRFVLAGEDSAPPVVLLLGCDTAVNELGFQTFVAQFREQGAAVVVGTIVSVLGRNAAPVAQTLVRDLATASRSKRAAATTFGEVMAASRRKLLARGELTALCLTAYGDADWVLAPRPA